MDVLQPKSNDQLFEATVNLEFDYFIKSLNENVTITEFGERVSIRDTENNGLAFYFDNSCIFIITPPDPDGSCPPIPRVERFYQKYSFAGMVQ